MYLIKADHFVGVGPISNERKCTISNDVIDIQVGCVLLQEQVDMVQRHIGYWFCSFCDVDTRYDPTHKAYLAVRRAVLLLFPTWKGLISVSG